MIARIVQSFERSEMERHGKPPSQKDLSRAIRVVTKEIVEGRTPHVDDIGAGKFCLILLLDIILNFCT